jgi:hypothetical protein
MHSEGILIQVLEGVKRFQFLWQITCSTQAESLYHSHLENIRTMTHVHVCSTDQSLMETFAPGTTFTCINKNLAKWKLHLLS